MVGKRVRLIILRSCNILIKKQLPSLLKKVRPTVYFSVRKKTALTYLHQSFIRVEVDHNEVRVVGIVVARVGGPPGVISSVPAVVVVKSLALLGQRVHATLDVDLQPR